MDFCQIESVIIFYLITFNIGKHIFAIQLKEPVCLLIKYIFNLKTEINLKLTAENLN